MPGVHPTLLGGGVVSPEWNRVFQALSGVAAMTRAAAFQTDNATLDQYQNVTGFIGDLAQSLPQGGSFAGAGSSVGALAIPGTLSPTGLTGYGIASCHYAPLATTSTGGTTMTVTASSTTVTVANATSMANGMGIAGYGIPAATKITNVAGTTLTISNPASASATLVPCSVFQWVQL